MFANNCHENKPQTDFISIKIGLLPSLLDFTGFLSFLKFNITWKNYWTLIRTVKQYYTTLWNTSSGNIFNKMSHVYRNL